MNEPPEEEIELEMFPPPTTGIHGWLFGRACFLRDRGVTEKSAEEGLKRICARAAIRRDVSDREIEDAIANAYGRADHRNAPEISQYDPVSGWPKWISCPAKRVDANAQREIFGTAFCEVDLWENSPVRLDGDPQTRCVLQRLFRLDELLCVGSKKWYSTRSLREWLFSHLERASLIVPNPMRARQGRKANGEPSGHCRGNTGPRRFIIVEFDEIGDHDAQAAILWHLKCETNAKLALVVQSGGKSLHGWFHCEDIPAAHLWAWFSYAVSLGADPRLWLPDQFCRLPDGTHANGQRQSVLYFDPLSPQSNA